MGADYLPRARWLATRIVEFIRARPALDRAFGRLHELHNRQMGYRQYGKCA